MIQILDVHLLLDLYEQFNVSQYFSLVKVHP